MSGFHRGAPVVVLAFNRPDYLDQVLSSMKVQGGVEVDPSQIFLFQDGAINAVSGKQYAETSDIEASTAVFRKHFPTSRTFVSADNIGVALNFDRAERFVFEELEAPVAYFFEDDLVLGKSYLRTMERLGDMALRDERIGYFAAYGHPNPSAEDHQKNRARLSLLGHNWAFGLTRRQWIRSRPYVNAYLSLVGGLDYRLRSHADVRALIGKWGAGYPGSSQDVVKSIACFMTGGLKLNTVTSYGRYIGENGLHFSPEIYQKLGFGSAVHTDDDLFDRGKLTDDEAMAIRGEFARYILEDMRAKVATPSG